MKIEVPRLSSPAMFAAVACLFVFSCAVNAGEVSVMYHNTCNYFMPGDKGGNPKDESSKESLVKSIKNADPDIFLAGEMGSQRALDDLLARMKKAGLSYQYSAFTSGVDSSRHIAVISKFPPESLECRNDLVYKIKPKDKESYPAEEVGVQRGFPRAVFKFENGYRLHVIGAHLKSRVFHPRYNQTDMRRYEARLLRYYINEIQDKEPGANIVVLGDMNDSFDTDPMITLRASDKPADKRLFDLRPLDSDSCAWTHWWNAEDLYGRIDYAFANHAVLPEVVLSKTRIPHVPELWMFASDHRPLMITIKTEDMPPLDPSVIEKNFPNSIRMEKR